MTEQQPLIPCKERELLLVILQQAIRDTIRARNQEESDFALRAWENARNALVEHMQAHGC